MDTKGGCDARTERFTLENHHAKRTVERLGSLRAKDPRWKNGATCSFSHILLVPSADDLRVGVTTFLQKGPQMAHLSAVQERSPGSFANRIPR